jgi:hypothetical protein
VTITQAVNEIDLEWWGKHRFYTSRTGDGDLEDTLNVRLRDNNGDRDITGPVVWRGVFSAADLAGIEFGGFIAHIEPIIVEHFISGKEIT